MLFWIFVPVKKWRQNVRQDQNVDVNIGHSVKTRMIYLILHLQ